MAEQETSRGGGSFPLTAITALEERVGYEKWAEEIDDWLVLNNLKPFTPTTSLKAVTAIKNRLGYNTRQIVKPEDNPQTILDIIKANFKREGTGVYMELVRRFERLTLESCKDVAEYTTKFREVDSELKSLHNDFAMPEAYIIHRYLTGLGDAYQTFYSIYTQSHNFSGPDKVTFSQVSLAASNEEQRIRAQQDSSTVAMVAKTNNNSGPGRDRTRGNQVSRPDRRDRKGPCTHYKEKNLPYRHEKATCWTLHPWLKPMKWKSDEERRLYPTEDPPIEKTKEEPVFANLANKYTIRGCSDPSQPMYTLVAAHQDLAGMIVVDTGCSRHAFTDRNAFISFRPAKGINPIAGIGGQTVKPMGEGTVQISLPDRNVRLQNVLYVPDLGANLLSVSQLLDSDVEVNITKNSIMLSHKSLGQIEAKRRHGIFVFESKMTPLGFNAYSVPNDPVQQL